MRRFLILFGLLFALGSATTLEAQVLKLSDGEGEPEESVTIAVSLDTDDPVDAFEFDVCDSGLVDIGFGDLELGAATEDIDFDTLIVSFEDDGWSIAAVLDTDSVIEAGEDLELYLATYELLEEGTETLSFCGDFLEPSLTIDGDEITPETESSTIEIAEPEPDDPEYSLSISDAEGDIDDEVSVTVTFSTDDGDDITAYEFDVCNDDLVSIGLGDISLGAAIEDLDFDSHVISYEDEGWSVAAILEGDVLENGVEHELYIATYTLLEEGISDLSFCGDLIAASFSAAGEEVELMTTDGIIDVGGFSVSSFTFKLEDKTVEFDSAGEGSFTVDMFVSENPDNDDYPQATTGLQMGIANDATYVLPTDVEAAGVLADLDGGSGPSFFGVNTDPDNGPGVTIGVVYDLFGGGTLEFEEESLVATLSYDLNADELEGEEEVLETELEFVDDLGDPPFPGSVVIADASGSGEANFDIGYDDAEITLQPEEIVDILEFRRGDTDGNGSVTALSDAGFLLRWAFASGDTPPCMDAADADDNGAVAALADALYLLRWAFSSGDEPPDPGIETCGEDPTDDDIDCETPPDCED